jgi:hypothetical protein
MTPKKNSKANPAKKELHIHVHIPGPSADPQRLAQQPDVTHVHVHIPTGGDGEGTDSN